MKNLNSRLKKLENRMLPLIDGYWSWPAKIEAFRQYFWSILPPEAKVFLTSMRPPDQAELINTHPAIWEICNETLLRAALELPPPYWMTLGEVLGAPL